MLLQQQIDSAVNEIVTKRRELGELLTLEYKGAVEAKRIVVLKSDLAILEKEVARARRWLSVCGVTV